MGKTMQPVERYEKWQTISDGWALVTEAGEVIKTISITENGLYRMGRTRYISSDAAMAAHESNKAHEAALTQLRTILQTQG